MKIGDLVKYCEGLEYASSERLNTNEELGIITKIDPIGMPLRCHVEWFTCDNRGWWTYKNLEVLSESR